MTTRAPKRADDDAGKTGIRDVAREAGVSLATVSRVLAGQSVRPSSREAVEKALARVDYRPNLAARRLRSRQPQRIGVIVADIANPFFARMVRKLEDLAWQEGLRLLIHSSDEDEEREATYLALLEEEGVDGVVLAPVAPSGRPAAAVRDGVAVVLVDRAARNTRYDAVTLDNEEACHALVDGLTGGGHREIVGLFRKASFTGDLRRLAFERAAAEQGAVAHAMSIAHTEADARAAIAGALETWPGATAVVAGDGLLLVETARALASRRGAVRLAGFDTGPWAPLLPPDTLLVEQPVADVAAQAFALMMRRLGEPTRLRTTIQLAASLKAADTL